MTEILFSTDKLIETLQRDMENTEVFYAFPDKEMTVPLMENYACSVSALLQNSSGKAVIHYELELVSPLKSTGRSILEQSQNVCRCISQCFSGEYVHCTIGNIIYHKTKRCYSVSITAEVSAEEFKECEIRTENEGGLSGVISSVKTECRLCDIMVYGMSQPFDTVLEKTITHITLQTVTPLAENISFSLSVQQSDSEILYTKCQVNQNSNGKRYFCYEITSYERKELPL